MLIRQVIFLTKIRTFAPVCNIFFLFWILTRNCICICQNIHQNYNAYFWHTYVDDKPSNHHLLQKNLFHFDGQEFLSVDISRFPGRLIITSICDIAVIFATSSVAEQRLRCPTGNLSIDNIRQMVYYLWVVELWPKNYWVLTRKVFPWKK